MSDCQGPGLYDQLRRRVSSQCPTAAGRLPHYQTKQQGARETDECAAWDCNLERNEPTRSKEQTQTCASNGLRNETCRTPPNRQPKRRGMGHSMDSQVGCQIGSRIRSKAAARGGKRNAHTGKQGARTKTLKGVRGNRSPSNTHSIYDRRG